MPLSLDDARRAFPHLGLALHAYEPGGRMTLEVISADGQTFQFTGQTEHALVARAFPALTAPADPMAAFG